MTHTLNTDRTVAVSQDTYWLPIGKDTPRGVKVLLLTQGGIAVVGQWDGKDKFYTDWAPMPKRRPE